MRLAVAVTVLAVLAACSKGDPKLMNISSGQTGPDEFTVLPTKPLDAPEDFTALPPPTPGGINRADPTPVADAVEALGGDGSRVTPSGLYAGEQALVSYTGRYGTVAGIRADLAAADLEYRRNHQGKLLERLFNNNVYFSAYAPMTLDQYAELARLRALGIWTPAAPPDPAG